MRKTMIILAAASAAAFATPALAAVNWTQGTVTLERAAARDTLVVDGKTAWRCDSTRCTGRLSDAARAAPRVCREFARRVGTVVAFETGAGAFDAEALGRCNAADQVQGR